MLSIDNNIEFIQLFEAAEAVAIKDFAFMMMLLLPLLLLGKAYLCNVNAQAKAKSHYMSSLMTRCYNTQQIE